MAIRQVYGKKEGLVGGHKIAAQGILASPAAGRKRSAGKKAMASSGAVDHTGQYLGIAGGHLASAKIRFETGFGSGMGLGQQGTGPPAG